MDRTRRQRPAPTGPTRTTGSATPSRSPAMTSSFPSAPSSLTNNNDLGAGIAFGSLTIADSGYSISGDSRLRSPRLTPRRLRDRARSICRSPCREPVSVDNSGAKLVLGGVISGSAGLTKNGAGYARPDGRQYLHGNDGDQRRHASGRRCSGGQPGDRRLGRHPGRDRDGRLDHGQRGNGQSGRRGAPAS